MDHGSNEQDWSAWVQAHADKLLMFARQQTQSEADAQDVVQEAVLEACRRQGEGKPPPLPLVFATIRRRAIDLARREDRRNQREQAAQPPDSASWFETSLEDREMSQLIQSAMKQLPKEQREVITLHLWGGLTFAEVAETLGIPVNTAASRYRYGLEGLRKLARKVLV